MSEPPDGSGGQIYWAPPPPGLQYGPPSPGPQYGQQYGQPYGPVYGAGPPSGQPPVGPKPAGSGRRLVAVAIAVVVGAAVAVAAFAVSQGNVKVVAGSAVAGSAVAAPSRSALPSNPSDTQPPRPTGSTAPADGPSLAASQAVATRYFNDLNAKNPADARTLLCDDAKSDFDTTVNDPDSDFTFSWTQITYRGVGAVDSDVTVLTYDTTLTRGSMSDQITVLLYFINENGVKLCGEDTV